jgi:hypothetical protein
MQSIDQQAAASQTSGQPLSRNSRIQTPNSCLLPACTHAHAHTSSYAGQLEAVEAAVAVAPQWQHQLVVWAADGGAAGAQGRGRGGAHCQCQQQPPPPLFAASSFRWSRPMTGDGADSAAASPRKLQELRAQLESIHRLQARACKGGAGSRRRRQRRTPPTAAGLQAPSAAATVSGSDAALALLSSQQSPKSRSPAPHSQAPAEAITAVEDQTAALSTPAAQQASCPPAAQPTPPSPPQSALPEGSTLHVRRIGGVCESFAEISRVFSRLGTVLQATIRHRESDDGQNTSWALVTMESSAAAQAALAQPVMAGTVQLVVNPFSQTQAAASTGAMGRIQRQANRLYSMQIGGDVPFCLRHNTFHWCAKTRADSGQQMRSP